MDESFPGSRRWRAKQLRGNPTTVESKPGERLCYHRGVSLLEWLNRSSQPHAQQILGALDEWFTMYPPEHRKDIRGRLDSRDDTQHYAASFELFLYALFSRLGFSVTVHPDVAGTSRHPDFRLEVAGGDYFFVEACVVEDPDAARDVLIGDLAACINEVESPEFEVLVEEIDGPGGTLPCEKIKRHVEGMRDARLAKPYRRKGWYIDFELHRKPPGLRLPTFGGGRVMAGSFDDVAPVRSAIAKKAEYPTLDAPYVIAVQALSPLARQGPGHDTFWEALLGDGVLTIPVSPERPRGDMEFRRLANGVLIRPNGSRYEAAPRYTRVSGLLAIASSSYPQDIWYYPNPSAARSLDNPFPPLSRYERQGNELVMVRGAPASRVLGLPQGWPHASVA